MKCQMPSNLDRMSLITVEKCCGVSHSEIEQWIKDGLTSTTDENGNKSIGEWDLYLFLSLHHPKEPLQKFSEHFRLRHYLLTNDISMSKVRVGALEYRKQEVAHIIDEANFLFMKYVDELLTIEEELKIKCDTKNVEPYFTSVPDMTAQLTVNEVAGLCKVSNQTIVDWEKDGLKFTKRKGMRTKCIEFYNLLDFLVKKKTLKRNLLNIYMTNFPEFIESCQNRIKNLNTYKKKTTKKRERQISKLIKDFEDDINNLDIMIPFSEDNEKDKSIQELVDKIVLQSTYHNASTVPQVANAKLKHIFPKMSEEELKKYFVQEKFKALKHWYNVYSKLKIEQTTDYKAEWGKKLLEDYNNNSFKAMGVLPINENLGMLGLTHKLINNELLLPSQQDIWNVAIFFIPDDKLTLDNLFAVYRIIIYMSEQKDQAFQLERLSGNHCSFLEMEIYCACRFLYFHLWAIGKGTTTRSSRIRALTYLLGMSSSKTNRIIRDANPAYSEEINEFLKFELPSILDAENAEVIKKKVEKQRQAKYYTIKDDTRKILRDFLLLPSQNIHEVLQKLRNQRNSKASDAPIKKAFVSLISERDIRLENKEILEYLQKELFEMNK
jgi:DNA-binding transcriptional MerR regulator